MANRDIIVIGGSAGALDPLMAIVRGLPVDFAESLFVVIHTPSESSSVLAEILLAKQNGQLEHALWQATRVLKERAAMHRQLAERANPRHHSKRYVEQALSEDANARLIEDLLRHPKPQRMELQEHEG